jgi:hypothetical protein
MNKLEKHIIKELTVFKITENGNTRLYFYDTKTKEKLDSKNFKNFKITTEPVQVWDINDVPKRQPLPAKFIAKINDNYFYDVVNRNIGLDQHVNIGDYVLVHTNRQPYNGNTNIGFWLSSYCFDIVESEDFNKAAQLIDIVNDDSFKSIYKINPINEVCTFIEKYKAWIDKTGAYFIENDKTISIKPGRLFKRILPTIKAESIEKLVNTYKAQTTIYEQKIVSGDDIINYYNENTYRPAGGSLNNSCMRYKDKEVVLQLYKNNPDKVQLLCLFDTRNKLVGRALLWKLKNGKIFMDRIYTICNYIEMQFIDRAIQEGWGYKKTQSAYDNTIIGIDNNELIVKLDWIPEKDNKSDSLHQFSTKFPYLDTMYYYRNKTIRTFPWETGYTELRHG